MRIRSAIRDEDGSAVVEFIALALPLFIPLAIFMANVQHDSSIQFQARNLARQVARAYVTSHSEIEGAQRVRILENTFMEEIFNQTSEISRPSIEITCSASPCLLPRSRIHIEVEIDRTDGRVLTKMGADEVVDTWRSTS